MAMVKAEETASHDLVSLLSSEERDFLVRNNNDQVKTSSLISKNVGLYFSGSWCGPCRRFTPKLVQTYELLSKQSDFEVVFISADRDEESFDAYFGKMPWLALPFSDSDMRKKLKMLFKVRGIPHLVILDKNGHVLTREGDHVIYDFGARGYPFTPERINQLEEEEDEIAKGEQSLRSLLVHSSRDFLISNGGNKVVVEELEGKTVGLYFFLNSNGLCADFTKMLVEIYNKLKERGENFEIVLVSSDEEAQEFSSGFGTMPWLSLPFKDKKCDELVRYFQIRGHYPTLVIIGPDGKTVSQNAVEMIEEHGDEGYPFTSQRFSEVAKAKSESQTLGSILVHQDGDFVLAKDGVKVPVTELVGKTILLYFSAEWCPPCRDFLPKFISVYEEIKAKDDAFEVIFISSDRTPLSFDDYFYSMPWLALPYGDDRKVILHRFFKIKGIPAIVALGPDGKTLHTQVRQLIQSYGAEAYPFNVEHVKAVEKKAEERAKGWPEKVRHELHHKHSLRLVRGSGFKCDGCSEVGFGWSYVCSECSFDLHPRCALKKEEFEFGSLRKEDFVCDGDVCHRA